MAFVGFGQNDSGGQAEASISPQTIVWNAATAPSTIVPGSAVRGPTNAGVLYQLSGSVVTSGFGQIFPTGRT